MTDSFTKEPIRVIREEEDAWPHIEVQLDQLDVVKKILDDAGYRYAVDKYALSFDDEPYILDVHLDFRADVAAVQKLLDDHEDPKLMRKGDRGVAIADEIDALARRTQNELDDLSDFGEHVDLIWKHFNFRVRQGDRLKSKNPRTRTEVTERGLVKRYSRYRRLYLQGLGFVQLTTILEAFVFDFLRLLLTNDPRHLAQRKQIEVGVVVGAVDKEAIVWLIVERELNELKYDRPRAWFDYMNKVVKLGCPTEDEIERIAEMKAARDLIIHNSGIVNAIYLDKAGSKARYALGETAVIDRAYFEDCWVLAKRLVDAIAAAAKHRLSQGGSR